MFLKKTACKWKEMWFEKNCCNIKLLVLQTFDQKLYTKTLIWSAFWFGLISYSKNLADSSIDEKFKICEKNLDLLDVLKIIEFEWCGISVFLLPWCNGQHGVDPRVGSSINSSVNTGMGSYRGSLSPMGSIYGCFQKYGYPKMDGL